MKKVIFMITTVVVIAGLTSCSNSEKETAKHDADNLSKYVDSVENATPVYTVANWTAIDNGYQERVAKADIASEKLEADDKARTEASKAKYAALKADYETKIKAAEASQAKASSDYRLILRNRLFGEGKIGADMKFDYVTSKNILSVYENFVNTVEKNKDEFTREDWDEIKVLYEALDSRKNEVEKDLSTVDNLKIGGLKITFGAIKAVKRPLAKASENEKAKS
jgi:hypothetical protein